MSAIISECGRYRRRLDRECRPAYEGSLVYAYFGINPSTACATIDDATVKKWTGFTLRNNGHKFIAGNLSDFRSKNPALLVNDTENNGPEYWKVINQIIAEADVLVPCWGRLCKLPVGKRHLPDLLLQALLESGKPVLHFGKTQCGQPKHPQMLAYATPLLPWVS